MRRVSDIGTNSVKLLVADCHGSAAGHRDRPANPPAGVYRAVDFNQTH